uniref:Zn(2)-C6 fungal-type domain-containing protein n=1 Tax=Ganoderma boninense TaxID=34458 RepID=A0A5K1JX74_9APHY|nr:Zn(2)-C6 fungal-type domain-containing protein [Ganoderma boninense]
MRRSETAAFIVDLEAYFSVSLGDNVFAELPSPPDHLDRETVEECRTITSMLAVARKSQYRVAWDAEEYSVNLSNSARSSSGFLEAKLMARYPPLIGLKAFTKCEEDHLPLLVGPAVVTDAHNRVLLWYLPQIFSEQQQNKILAAIRLLEAQLTFGDINSGAPRTDRWRDSASLFSVGG